MTAAIETEGLTRGFKSGLAVDGLTFTLEPGQVLALLGPNGAGKTTTVRLLDGVLLPHAGRSTVLGHDPATEGDAVRRRTGVLTENAGLDDRLTSRENLLYVARLRGFGKADALRRVDELLERFGMGERRDDLTGGFSTGQRKRVALARALLHDPELLFLDEPTSGLDPAGTRDVIALIDELAAEGRTVVLATHFLGEAGRLADRMAVLHRGRLRAFGAPDDLAAELWTGVGAELDLGGPGRRRHRRHPVGRARRASRRGPRRGCPPRARRPRRPPPRRRRRGRPRRAGLRRRHPQAHPRGRLLRHRAPHRRGGGRARHRRLHRPRAAPPQNRGCPSPTRFASGSPRCPPTPTRAGRRGGRRERPPRHAPSTGWPSARSSAATSAPCAARRPSPCR